MQLDDILSDVAILIFDDSLKIEVRASAEDFLDEVIAIIEENGINVLEKGNTTHIKTHLCKLKELADYLKYKAELAGLKCKIFDKTKHLQSCVESEPYIGEAGQIDPSSNLDLP